jgi:ABC-type glutathione transport system ATPase component
MQTHNVAMASPIADFVVALGTDGRVTSQGSVADALKHDKRLRAALEKEKVVEEKAEEVIDEQAPADDNKKKSDGKLVVAEEIAEGHVRWPASEFAYSESPSVSLTSLKSSCTYSILVALFSGSYSWEVFSCAIC